MLIYYTDITKMKEEDCTLLMPFISKKRREKIEKYYHADDKKRSICTELLLKYCVQKRFGNGKEIVLTYNQYGKPLCCLPKDFHFNISHSGKWVVIAAGNCNVGIDVEEIRRDKCEDVIDCFSVSENLYVNCEDLVEQKKRFIHIWSMKESFVKYLGTGLKTNFNSFCVDPYSGKVHYITEVQPVIKSWLFDKDYYMSLCCQQEIEEQKEIEFRELYHMYVNGAMDDENSVS